MEGGSANPPTNAIDNNLNSWWTTNGVGSWITVGFDSIKVVCSVDIAWYRGNHRQNDFNIRVWDTPSQQWKTVFTGKSSGTTAGLERYDFSDISGRSVAIDLLHLVITVLS